MSADTALDLVILALCGVALVLLVSRWCDREERRLHRQVRRRVEMRRREPLWRCEWCGDLLPPSNRSSVTGEPVEDKPSCGRCGTDRHVFQEGRA